ncbi:Long-chain-fatty-acid--CoA ligase [Sandaracinus amylolyticus]|uniref:Long-chain-fatty-acid--CoA ligase n=1 Tax=Sandaracinus amylolyticus TaxID=927083 RepID=A0A0F6YII8_9BACT|nr:Long-chain-fatty-acid--CoA ligase [Sandaracinus amylolyticus]
MSATVRRVRAPVDLARVATRLGVRSGIAFDVSPRGVIALARARLSGSLGLATIFRVHAANTPDAIAIVCEGRRLTYRALDERIDRLASRLRHEHGIGRGDAAILLMHNRAEFVEVQAAMTRLGGAAVSASYRSTPEELEFLASHSGARAIFVEAELAAPIVASRAKLTGVPDANLIAVGGTHPGTTSYDALVAPGRVRPIDEASGDDAAVVVYTSGTTGKPKGAVRRFPKDAHLAFLQSIDELDIRHDDRHLAVCPLYHTTAFGFASFTFVLGGTVVIEPRFDAQRALAKIEEHAITTTAMVPTMLHRILELPAAARREHDTRSLRAVFSAGAPLSGAVARDFMQEFGHVLYNIYGATETGLNTIATPDELLRAPGTIGHVVPGNEIRILDERGRDVPRGATGELFVRNTMLVDYHRDDAATRASMRDGFFSVGDLAHVDEHGLVHLDGRKRDMIISGGVNVYPAEVEEVLARHPAVREAAVVGVPDREWGERVRAFVALREGAYADVPSLIAWCRDRLSGPKVPRDVRVMQELPKNPTGKVLKRELREMA